MLRIIFSCGSVPALYLRSNRDAPSASTVAAIFRATVSGDADVERAHGDLAVVLGPAGRAPAALGADPVPHHLVVGPELLAGLLVGVGDVAGRVDADRAASALPSWARAWW